jgi:formylglycine-generating enzyme required for sulfatase activity
LRTHTPPAPFLSLLLFAALLSFSLPASAVSIDWVSVGNPGNACSTQSQGCFGDVAYAYQIAKHEVTVGQYTEFLNAVAAADPNSLYNTQMDTSFGMITRSGSSGSYSYTATAGLENSPVPAVNFYDALRFANWLNNGQPSGAQDNTTTEDGSYTITGQGILDNSIARNPGATIVLTSEDEWFKAAYYNAISTSYFIFPAGTNTTIVCAAPGATPNTASCNSVAGITSVGSYTGSPSPYGTYDQGGNLWEWNEAVVDGSSRGVRGGAFHVQALLTASGFRHQADPAGEDNLVGFRVVNVIPEPRTGLLLMTGLLGLAYRQRRRRRAG